MAQASLAGRSVSAPAPHAAVARGRAKLPLPVLIYLLAVTVPVAFFLGPLYMTGLRLFLIVMTVPLALRLFQGHYGRLVLTDWLLLVHIGWMAVTMLKHHGGGAIQNSGIYAVELYGGYVLARAYIRDAATFAALIRAIVGIILVLLPLALIESQTGRPPVIEFIRSLPVLLSVEITHMDVRLGLERSQVVFAHPIHFGLFCSTMFSMCYVGLKGEVSTFTRLALTAASGLGAFLALSSGAILAVMMHLMLIGWATVMHGVKARWAVLLGVTVTCYVVVDLLSNRTPFDVFLSYATLNPATAYWRSLIFEFGMQNLNRSPVFGIGLNDWTRPWWMFTASVDNFWLLTGMRHGYPGLITLAAGYVWMLWRVGRLDLDGDERLWRYRRAWMFTFAGLTFTLCTVHIWTSVFSYVFFLFGSGLWLLEAAERAGRASPDEAQEEAPAATRGVVYARGPGEARADRSERRPVFARGPETRPEPRAGAGQGPAYSRQAAHRAARTEQRSARGRGPSYRRRGRDPDRDPGPRGG